MVNKIPLNDEEAKELFEVVIDEIKENPDNLVLAAISGRLMAVIDDEYLKEHSDE